MASVTTSASPRLMDRNRSASGTAHSRWSQGSYDGVKCSATIAGSSSSFSLSRTSNRRARSGKRWQKLNRASMNTMFFVRITRWATLVGSSSRIRSASLSRSGTEPIHVGLRCSIVTCAASGAMAGTRVTAVAPLPTTTTRRPAYSRCSGQNCGCTTSPANDSMPGKSGV